VDIFSSDHGTDTLGVRVNPRFTSSCALSRYAVAPSISRLHDPLDNCARGNTLFHFMLVAPLATIPHFFNLRQ
jgi:hypothetical protein